MSFKNLTCQLSFPTPTPLYSQYIRLSSLPSNRWTLKHQCTPITFRSSEILLPIRPTGSKAATENTTSDVSYIEVHAPSPRCLHYPPHRRRLLHRERHKHLLRRLPRPASLRHDQPRIPPRQSCRPVRLRHSGRGQLPERRPHTHLPGQPESSRPGGVRRTDPGRHLRHRR